MPRSSVTSEEFAMIDRVLHAYCKANGVADPVEKNDMAAILLTLFQMGCRTEKSLTAKLASEREK